MSSSAGDGNRKRKGTKRPHPATTTGSTESSSASAGDAGFQYHTLLRLFADARLVFLNSKGGQAKKQKDLFWVSMLNWAIPIANSASQPPANAQLLHGDLLKLRRLAHFLFNACKPKAEKCDVTVPAEGDDPSQFTIAVCKQQALLSQIYKYAMFLLPYNWNKRTVDTHAFDMFDTISKVEGRPTAILDPSDTIAVLPPSKLPPSKYFEQWFFKIEPAGRRTYNPTYKGRFIPPPFLLCLKLAADHISRTSTTRRRTITSKKAPVEAIGVAVEIIYYAWCALARQLSFRYAAEMLSPFIYVDGDTGKLHTMPTGRCIPASYNAKLYVTTNAAQVGPQDAEITPQAEAVPGVLFNDPLAPEFIRKLSPTTAEKLRTFACQFVDDILKYSACPGVTKRKAQNVHEAGEMVPFTIPQDGALPTRFAIELHQMKSIYNNVAYALYNIRYAGRSADEDADASPTAIPASQGPHPHQTPVSQGHTCNTEEECDCDRLRDDVQSLILRHVTISDVAMNDFFKETENDPDNPSLENKVQLILADPPYNTRRQQGRANSDYDTLHRKDMPRAVDLCARILRPGGHIVLFCSIEQFSSWRKHFQQHKSKTFDTPTFHVTMTPLVFIPEQGAVSRAPYHRKLTHSNITEFAVHAAKPLVQGTMAQAVSMVSWKQHGYVHSTQPAHYNVVDGVPRLAQGELLPLSLLSAPSKAIQGGDGGGDGDNDDDDEVRDFDKVDDDGNVTKKRGLLRPEQKSLALCMELIERYSKPGDTVVDFFAGTCTTAVACLSVHGARTFFGCDIDKTVVNRGRTRVLNAFINNAVNGHVPTGIEVTDALLEKMKTLVKRNKYDVNSRQGALSGSMQQIVPAAPQFAHLPRMQRIPEYILHFLAGEHHDTRFCNNIVSATTPDNWEKELFGTLSMSNVRTLRSIAAGRAMILVREPSRLGDFAGQGVIAMTQIVKNSHIGSAFGTLFYNTWAETTGSSNLFYNLGRLYGVKRNEFKVRRIPLLGQGSALHAANDTRIPSVYLVPTRFCPFAYARKGDAEHCNAVYRVRSPARVTIDLITSPDHVQVIATKDISAGEEIWISNKPDYLV